MNTKKIISSFKTFTKFASLLLKDKNKTFSKIREGMSKADLNKGKLSEVWEQLQSLFSLARDYANGTYKNVSHTSIVTIIGGLLYFISPLDVIPDFILGIGFIDDAFVIAYVFKKVAKEMDKYQEWKSGQKKMIHI